MIPDIGERPVTADEWIALMIAREGESSAQSRGISKPTEHKTVQARIFAYAEAIGWTIVVCGGEAEERRGGILAPLGGKGGDRNVPAPLSLFFDDLLDAKVREFNPRYAEA